MTYKEAFDKLTHAYIHGEVNFMNGNFCFCGNLCDKTGNWQYSRSFADNVGNPLLHKGYTYKQYKEMESRFMAPITYCFENILPRPRMGNWAGMVEQINNGELFIEGYEDAVFQGFEKALEVLKEIHISRGEIVDDSLVFQKRELTLV